MNITSLIIISLIGTGISSIAIQIITVREFLSQFAGNEITISLVLFCWLIVGGFGSLVSKSFHRKSVTIYSVMALVTALLPLIQISAIRVARDAIFIHGESPGFYPILTAATYSQYKRSGRFCQPRQSRNAQRLPQGLQRSAASPRATRAPRHEVRRPALSAPPTVRGSPSQRPAQRPARAEPQHVGR